MKYKKLALVLPLIAYSAAANAEIELDVENNVKYTNAKGTVMEIKADGSASLNGTLVKKCEGTEGGKVTKSKLGSVTCDDGFVVLKDKSGTILSRFSSYALVTDNRGTNERKLFDPALAKLGSPTSGASELSQTQETVVEQTKTTTVQTLRPGEGYLNRPKVEAPVIDQKNYTPKLGVMAERTPAVTKTRKPEEIKVDRAVAKAEKAARTAPPGSTVPMPEINQPPVVLESTTSPVTETKTVTTTIKQPTPSAAAAGATPATQVKTDTKVIPASEEEQERVTTTTTITPGAPISTPVPTAQ